MSVSPTRAGGRSGWLMMLLVITGAIIVILGTYKVWYHYQTVGLGYQLAEETVRHRRLFGKNRKLRIELASLKRAGLLRLRSGAPLVGAGVAALPSTGADSGRPRMVLPGPEDLIIVPPAETHTGGSRDAGEEPGDEN